MRATDLSGWGRYPIRQCRLATLRREEQLAEWSQTKTLIARGNGRSYGDAALNPELTLSMLAMDRLLAFDASRGVLSCEAGVLLADLLRVFAPQGWFPPVVPGTADVTVGGMIAADVHGKNHHRDGSFGAHVESFRLATANGDVLTCSREKNSDLFRATLGGMGLTGIVLSARFRMCRIESEYVRTETLCARDLDGTMELLKASDDWRYSVAWIDGSAKGADLGRGLVSRGDFATRDELSAQPSAYRARSAGSRPLRIPAMLSGVLNPASIRLFDALYNRIGHLRRGPRLVCHTSFFFPLDRLQGWNRLYGSRGFVQYQCVLPMSRGSRGLQGDPGARGGIGPHHLPRRSQAVRTARRGDDVVPVARIYARAGLPDAPGYVGTLRFARRDHHGARGARLPGEGRAQPTGARAGGICSPAVVHRRTPRCD